MSLLLFVVTGLETGCPSAVRESQRVCPETAYQRRPPGPRDVVRGASRSRWSPHLVRHWWPANVWLKPTIGQRSVSITDGHR